MRLWGQRVDFERERMIEHRAADETYGDAKQRTTRQEPRVVRIGLEPGIQKLLLLPPGSEVRQAKDLRRVRFAEGVVHRKSARCGFAHGAHNRRLCVQLHETQSLRSGRRKRCPGARMLRRAARCRLKAMDRLMARLRAVHAREFSSTEVKVVASHIKRPGCGSVCQHELECGSDLAGDCVLQGEDTRLIV